VPLRNWYESDMVGGGVMGFPVALSNAPEIKVAPLRGIAQGRQYSPMYEDLGFSG